MSNKCDEGESRLNEYEVVKKIGNGRFGEVFLVKHKRTQEFFCWKAISYRGLKEREKSQLVIEVNVMRELKHKNIVRYIDRFLNKANQKLYILMEFCDAGDLSRNIQKCYKMFGKIEEHAVLDITRQLLHALAYCHNLKDGPNGEKVLHRDLKPQNIFLSTGIRHIGKITAQANNLTSRPIAKIGDFGLSKNIGIESMAHSCVGTPYYWSPELLLHETKSYDDKSDMWALGCIIYELCSGKTPFHKANNFAQLVSELKKGPELPIKGKSKELNMLIQSLLHLSPKERPSALQCLGFQIIKQITPPINRKESITDQNKPENTKRIEGATYTPSSQNSIVPKRDIEKQRSSSCLSRQNINAMNKDISKYNPEVLKSNYKVNGQYAMTSGKMYNMEKERFAEKENLKREMMEREQIERNMLEKKNAQKKAMEMKLLEQKRMEREKIEREKIERDKMERFEREKLKKLERERIERMKREAMEKIAREKLEREKIEREKIGREKIEREKLEREKLEREKLERLERERRNREKLERERIERERTERERMERLERERTDRERMGRLERERADRERLRRLERERAETERKEKYYMREAQSNSKLEAIEKMRLHSRNDDNYSSSKIKERYEPIGNLKNYSYNSNNKVVANKTKQSSMYAGDDDDHYVDDDHDDGMDCPSPIEKRDRDHYLRSHSASNVPIKNISRYNNVNSSESKNSNVSLMGYNNVSMNPCNVSPYSNTSGDSASYKTISKGQRNVSALPRDVNILKRPKDLHKDITNISYQDSNYEKGYMPKAYIENDNVCKSNRISNMYFNDSARRSSSAVTHINTNTSRNRSGTLLQQNNEYERSKLEENKNFKNLEKDREYLLEKKKILLEKEKEIYGMAKHNGNYDYPAIQRRDRYENMKVLEKANESRSRRSSVSSVSMKEPENRNSFRMKKQPITKNEEEYYMMRNKNMYDSKKIGRMDKYEAGVYTCR